MARSILVIVYHLVRDQMSYRDLGSAYLDQRDQQALQRRLGHCLQGFDVELHPKESVEVAV